MSLWFLFSSYFSLSLTLFLLYYDPTSKALNAKMKFLNDKLRYFIYYYKNENESPKL